MKDLEWHSQHGGLPRKTADTDYLGQLRAYFAAMQPEWIVDAEHGWLRAVVDGYPDLATEKYILRHVIDVDLHLAETPQGLERLMLLQIIQSYRAAIKDLLEKGVLP